MKISKSAKFMGLGIVLSLGWFVLEACECDSTKEENYPGFWVSCVNNKPTLMTYNDNSATVVTSDPAGSFNPDEYDCTHANSPQYKGSEASPYQLSTPAGPGGFARPHTTTTSTQPTTVSYLMRTLLSLPFQPNVPPNPNPMCSSSYPDVFQTNHTLSTVTRFSTCPFAVKAVINVQTRPLQVAITPDGSMAIVTSFDNSINFIDLSSNKVTYTLNTDPSINPNGIAISPDGSTLYITSFNTNFPVVEVINIKTHQVITNIETSMTYPSGLTISPDGQQIWVTSTLDNGVDVIDLATNTRVTTLPINLATDIAFNSIGTRAYITSASPNPGVKGLVYAVDGGTYKVLTTYTVGVTPADITMSYADQFLVVNNSGDNSVSIIDLIKSVVTTANVGGTPSGISFVQ